MLSLLLIFVLAPMAVAAPGLAGEVKDLVTQGMAWVESAPQLPAWITDLPLVGSSIASTWDGLLAQTPEAKAMLMSFSQPVRQFLTDAAFGLASSVMDFAVALIVATSFWSRGDKVAVVLRDSLSRLGGQQLADLTNVAASATRGVFYGIVGTAVIQGLLMAIGVLLAGVPGAAPLGFVTLIFAISQFGGVLINLVWVGAAWWLYSTSGMGPAFWFIVAWGLLVTFSDNLLKPLLIGSSIKLPLMLIILGVFGALSPSASWACLLAPRSWQWPSNFWQLGAGASGLPRLRETFSDGWWMLARTGACVLSCRQLVQTGRCT